MLIVESQPPNTGEFLQALAQLERYEFLYICINSPPAVLPLQRVGAIWASIFKLYGKRIAVVFVTDSFVDAAKSELPEIFDGCDYLTTNKKIFVHLSTMNVDVELIPHALGYRGIFLRNAYRQSRALDWIESRFINTINKDKR